MKAAISKTLSVFLLLVVSIVVIVVAIDLTDNVERNDSYLDNKDGVIRATNQSGKGTLIVSMTDKVDARIEKYGNFMVDVDDVAIQYVDGERETITDADMSFNLLELKNQTKLALINAVDLRADEVVAIRMEIDDAYVEDATDIDININEGVEIRIPLNFTITQGQVTAVTIDMILDQSLTVMEESDTDVKFAFMPTIEATVTTDAMVSIRADNNNEVVVEGGSVIASEKVSVNNEFNLSASGSAVIDEDFVSNIKADAVVLNAEVEALLDQMVNISADVTQEISTELIGAKAMLQAEINALEDATATARADAKSSAQAAQADLEEVIEDAQITIDANVDAITDTAVDIQGNPDSDATTNIDATNESTVENTNTSENTTVNTNTKTQSKSDTTINHY